MSAYQVMRINVKGIKEEENHILRVSLAQLC